MSARYVRSGGVAVELGGGSGDAADQFLGLLSDGVAAASSSRLSFAVTASATPHTEGSWVEVDASLSAAASGLLITPTVATAINSTDTSSLLEIGVGAAAAETVWATVAVGYAPVNVPNHPIHVPGGLAAGTRVSVRLRSAVALHSCTADIFFIAEGSVLLGAPVTYGANTATSRGVDLTVPGSLNTKGAWTQIVASTTEDLVALTTCIQGAADLSLTGTNPEVLVDVGIGPAASETVLIADMFLVAQAIEAYARRSPQTFEVAAPLGSRLSARYAHAAVANTVDLFLVGTPLA